MKKMGCAQCGGAKMKKGGKVPAKKMQKGGSMGIVGMPKYGNNPMTDEGRMLQKGGSKVTAVKHSCPPGTVRMPDGRCGTRETPSFKKGGSAFGMLSVKAGIDKNPKPTAADRIAGAKMKKRK